MPNAIDKVDKRSWGIRLLLGETSKTAPKDVKVIQMSSAPSGGWNFWLVKRAWHVELPVDGVQAIRIEQERSGTARLDTDMPSSDACLVVEHTNGSAQIFLRALDSSMLEVAMDAFLEGNASDSYKAAIDSFGVACGIADAIVRARVKSLRLRQTAATQGRTKASRRALRGWPPVDGR